MLSLPRLVALLAIASASTVASIGQQTHPFPPETLAPAPPADKPGITITSLTNTQVDNLAALAEVWGFLKYHHPAVTAGKLDWDAQLFKIMPIILAAPTPAERNHGLETWLDSLGPLQPCSPCAELDASKTKLAPDLAWMDNEHRWGPSLSKKLKNVYRNRSRTQFYVARRTQGAANPQFQQEDSYARAPFPDAGYQLLTLFRWWAMYEWWYPNRDLLPDLHQTLHSYIRPMALAANQHDFVLETMKLIGEAHDTHANLWNMLRDRPPVGDCNVDAALRFVDGNATVWSVFATNTALQRGDIIESLDGQSVTKLLSEWRSYYADSNESARLRDIAQQMTGGACGPVKLGVRRAGLNITVDSVRVKGVYAKPEMQVHDRVGDAFQMLSPNVAYLKLSAVVEADVKTYVARAEGTKGWSSTSATIPQRLSSLTWETCSPQWTTRLSCASLEWTKPTPVPFSCSPISI